MRLEIQYVRPESLTPAAPQRRNSGRKALSSLAQVIDHHGFVVPIIARGRDRLILDGHQRLRANALRAAPDPLVPCILLPDLSDDQAVALTVALNNPVLQGHFNEKRLATILADLAKTRANVSAATGFSPEDLADAEEVFEILQPVSDLSGDQAAGGDDVATPQETPETVVAVFEVERELFAVVKPRFDELIARYGLTCHVRMEDAR